MKVALIEVPRFTFPLNHASNVVVAPLGLAYIAAAVEAAGHKVQIIDGVGEAMTKYTKFGPVFIRGMEFKDLVDRVESDVDVIGLSNMFSCGWLATRLLLRKLKERFPNKPIVFGGEHPSGMPELVMEQSPVDVIVMGEGEETIVEVLEYFSSGKPALKDITGICFREDGKTVRNGPRARIRSVDDIAEPAWQHFKIDDYIELGQPHGAVQGRFLPMLATRGCPYKCTFCTSAQMWTQRWVPRNYVKVVDEMEKYMRTYNATDFHFEDLTAIVKRDWMLDFASEIMKRGMKVTYQLPSGTRSEAIDREVARALKGSGCSDFPFAPESGDPRILKAIEKRIDLDRMFEAADEAISEGISVTCNFIIGFPEDDWKSVFLMYKAIVRCAWHGFSGVNINAFSPQPNTAQFDRLVEQGKIPIFDDKYFLSLFTFQSFFVKKTSYNETFSSMTLTLIIILGFFVFYSSYFLSRPQRIFHFLRSFFVKTTINKTTTYGRSMVREAKRIWLFRQSLQKEYTFDKF
jgi:radical SAM superfamily enzyme YgiQ (UPF0313 family)